MKSPDPGLYPEFTHDKKYFYVTGDIDTGILPEDKKELLRKMHLNLFVFLPRIKRQKK